MKKALIIIAACILAGYLIFAAFFFESQPKSQLCSQFEVVSVDNKGQNLVDVAEIEKEITQKGLNPFGVNIKDINTYQIEQAILENKLIKTAKVFVTGDGGVRAEIINRKPVLRIINNSGESYYIDNDGEKVPLSKVFTADLPLATGAISEKFAKEELLNFAYFLSENTFWDNLIEQIVVLPNEEVKLVPRIGRQEILFGKLEGYEEKFDKLKLFYEKGLSETGWDRYSAINLKYNKQVIGTKR
ncbi:hypothetical protein D0T53_04435 [Dysgonomonas sp. 216]|uniref:cell division protein FtsQ/DivIB n=1 Tax=Dysgonomonas sp. 216 TaxID=2302934 RepID=UPI0013D31B65|nr:hypothetical protein [Dysgonomonas sp. 216]NDW18165.1 hypothetical protein [Dysgonomonas sp. 216]